jgi:uncharacterized RDD family membrane protein YckC
MDKSLSLNKEIEKVGFGKRLGSSLLDFTISLLPGIILGIYAGAAMAAFLLGFFYDEAQLETIQAGFSGELAATIIGLVASLAGVAFTSIFFYVLEGFTGQTPGKMILGITVANINGEKATIDKLLLRAFIKIIGSFVGIIGFIIFIGCFLVLGEKKQALHDIICKTAVFKKSDLT